MDNRALCRADWSPIVLYASLKAVHLLAIVVWVGGMFFMLACLRPAAAAVLGPPDRLRLMHATLRRFFAVVSVAAVLALASGGVMVALARSAAVKNGLSFNMPLDWYTMVAVFFVMAAVFLHMRLVLFRRLAGAVASERWAEGATALGLLRWEVTLNLVLGVFVIAVMRLGSAA